MSIAENLQEIKGVKQWVAFRFEERNGKRTKVPVNPHTGGNAQTNNPETWGTLAQAQEAVKRYGVDGVGFVFANGYFGIDLDHVIDPEARTIKKHAQDIIDTVDSYTELSPSGTGVHIIAKGSPDFDRNRNDDLGLEMYYPTFKEDGTISRGRYFTVTGNAYGAVKPIAERTKQAQAVYKKYLYREPQKAPASTSVGTPVTDSDADIITKALNSKNGARFGALWQGDISGYGNDHSRATQALVNDLAYWTNGDPVAMDRLFRQSGLYSTMKVERGVNKWDKVHSQGRTYGQATIETALASFTPYVAPVRTERRPFTGTPDFNPERAQESPQTQEAGTPDNLLEYLEGGHLQTAIEHFKSFRELKTGFSNYDKVQPLYPGLYVVGAISSLGKTTFCHQLGDQLAQQGEHVLYFSIEQNRLEMVTKGLSRLTAQINEADALSAIDIRRGSTNGTLKKAVEKYKTFAKNISIIECSFDVLEEDIIQYVEDYIKATGLSPVVIIDYLQIIPGTPDHLGRRPTTKDAVDSHVRAFKKLQSKHDLVLFLIASLNRQNYLTPVDFESFKESGGIEYTSDFVAGLQLQCLNEDIFSKKEDVKAKRERIKEAKAEDPRRIELVCLKNRYGKPSFSVFFDYYPRHDLLMVKQPTPETKKKGR